MSLKKNGIDYINYLETVLYYINDELLLRDDYMMDKRCLSQMILTIYITLGRFYIASMTNYYSEKII